jgi:hypothetical protein
MLWTIAVILIILWMLGLVTGFTMGSAIHIIFAAAVQPQSGGDDQPEVATCIAKSRPKTRRQTEARTVSRPADTVTDYTLRCRMDAIVIPNSVDTGLKKYDPG